MSAYFRTFLVVLIYFIGIPAFGQYVSKPLSGSEIQSQMFGRLLSGDYPNGERWAERFNYDGSSDYSENGNVRRGKMTLTGNVLCFSYDTEKDSGGCFEIWKRSPNCFDFYGARSDASLDQRNFGKAWDARGWYSGQPSTCTSEQIS